MKEGEEVPPTTSYGFVCESISTKNQKVVQKPVFRFEDLCETCQGAVAVLIEKITLKPKPKGRPRKAEAAEAEVSPAPARGRGRKPVKEYSEDAPAAGSISKTASELTEVFGDSAPATGSNGESKSVEQPF